MSDEATGAITPPAGQSPSAALEALIKAEITDPMYAAEEQAPEGDKPAPEVEGDDTPEPETEPEAEPEGEPEEEGETPNLVEVTLPGGEKAKVTLDELRSGYSRTADYTRKTQEVAEARKQIEAKKSEVTALENYYKQNLEIVAQVLQQEAPKEPPEELLEDNPTEYHRQMRRYNEKVQKLQAVQQEWQTVEARREAEMNKARAEFIQSESQALESKLPEWKDAAKRTEMGREIAGFLLNEGFTKEEIGQLVDHRTLLVALKAMKYDALQKSKPEITKRVAQVPKVVKPGAAAPRKTKGEASDEAIARAATAVQKGSKDSYDALWRTVLTENSK